MFDRENLVGVLFLGLCAVLSGVLLYSIGTGTRFEFRGPPVVGMLLAVLFFGGILYGLLSGRGRRWPNPMTGDHRWWHRLWPWSRHRDDR